MNKRQIELYLVKAFFVFSLVGLLGSCGGGGSDTPEPTPLDQSGVGSVQVDVAETVPEAAASKIVKISTLAETKRVGSDGAVINIVGGVEPVVAEDKNGDMVLLSIAVNADAARVKLDAKTTARSLVHLSPAFLLRTSDERASLVLGLRKSNADFSSLILLITDHLQAGTSWSDDTQIHILASQVASGLLQKSATTVTLSKAKIYNTIKQQGEPPYLGVSNNSIDFRNPQLIHYAAQVFDAQNGSALYPFGLPVEGRQSFLDLVDEITEYGSLPPSTNSNKQYVIYFSRGGLTAYDNLTATTDYAAAVYNALNVVIKSVILAVSSKSPNTGAILQQVFGMLPWESVVRYGAELSNAAATGSKVEVAKSLIRISGELTPLVQDVLADSATNAVLGVATNPGLYGKFAKLLGTTFKVLSSKAEQGMNLLAAVPGTVEFAYDFITSARIATYLVSVSPDGILTAVKALGEDNVTPANNIVRDFFASNQPSGVTATRNSDGSVTVSWSADADIWGYKIYDQNFVLISTDDINLLVGSNGSTSYTIPASLNVTSIYISSVNSLGTESITVAMPATSDDHGNDIATATTITENTSTVGELEKGGDIDYFRVEIVGDGTLNVYTTGGTFTFGELLDSTGRGIVSDDDSGSSLNFRLSQAVTSGTYYVRVRGDYDTTTGAYTLVSEYTGNVASPSSVQVREGDGEIALSWNTVTGAESYTLYWGVSSGQGAGGILLAASSPATITGLTNGVTYSFMVSATVGGVEGVRSAEVFGTPYAVPVIISPLNDTGITWGGNYPDGNNITCIGETIAEQDCSHGRDAQAATGTLTKVGGGQAGFDFTKLDANGNALPFSATRWNCVRDNHTGLVWEVKTTDGGIHNESNTYRWGGKTALLTGTFGTRYNDWDTLVDGSNAGSGLCGFTDWRVPSREELLSIVNYNQAWPVIDTAYFSNTVGGNYWSASPVAGDSGLAWGVDFDNGYVTFKYRSRYNVSYRVRLVRGGQ